MKFPAILASADVRELDPLFLDSWVLFAVSTAVSLRLQKTDFFLSLPFSALLLERDSTLDDKEEPSFSDE